MFRICTEFSVMFRICSEFSVIFRICSEFSVIFRIFSNLQNLFRIFRICSESGPYIYPRIPQNTNNIKILKDFGFLIFFYSVDGDISQKAMLIELLFVLNY